MLFFQYINNEYLVFCVDIGYPRIFITYGFPQLYHIFPYNHRCLIWIPLAVSINFDSTAVWGHLHPDESSTGGIRLEAGTVFPSFPVRTLIPTMWSDSLVGSGLT